MNKYEKLYNEFVEFHNLTGIWNSNKRRSSTITELNEFQESYDIHFGDAFRNYLLVLGNGRRSNGGISFSNYEGVKFATKYFRKMNIYQPEQNIKLISRTEKDISLKRICCIHFVDYNGYFTIIDPKEENPNLFGGEAYDFSFDWHEMNFTSHLRIEVHQLVKAICRNKMEHRENIKPMNTAMRELSARVDLTKFQWTEYYCSKHINEGMKMFEFIKIIEAEEFEHDLIVGFEEFEKRYINYIESSL